MGLVWFGLGMVVFLWTIILFSVAHRLVRFCRTFRWTDLVPRVRLVYRGKL